jgi:hypothetical protein
VDDGAPGRVDVCRKLAADFFDCYADGLCSSRQYTLRDISRICILPLKDAEFLKKKKKKKKKSPFGVG